MRELHVWMPLVETGTGSEGYTHALAQRLRERGHRVTLDSVPHRYQYFPRFIPVNPPKHADVILANSWNAASFARHSLPLVSVCHLVVHDERLAPYKSLAQAVFHRFFVLPMERAAVRRATINVAVSPLVSRQMKRLLAARDVVTVNNGIDTDFFTPADGGHDGAPFSLLFVGKPSLRKGFDTAARIIDALEGKVRFTCVGPPPAPDLPRPEGEYTGVMDKTALREAYRTADMLLFPSRMEGLSLAVAEAMACGLPVLACEGSSMDEFVPADGGIVRAADDIAGFAADLEAVMADPARHARMRQVSRDYACEHLSEKRWVEGMEEILLQAATASRP